jgi:hypothetical protein
VPENRISSVLLTECQWSYAALRDTLMYRSPPGWLTADHGPWDVAFVKTSLPLCCCYCGRTPGNHSVAEEPSAIHHMVLTVPSASWEELGASDMWSEAAINLTNSLATHLCQRCIHCMLFVLSVQEYKKSICPFWNNNPWFAFSIFSFQVHLWYSSELVNFSRGDTEALTVSNKRLFFRSSVSKQSSKFIMYVMY